MFAVDTNVLIYAADRDAREHARCRALLERWRTQNGAWYLTWGVCYEFLRVVTHRKVFRHPWTLDAANGFLRAVQSSPAVTMLVPGERHAAVLADIIAEVPELSGNIVHDLTTAALLREHGIRRIVTRDSDFSRFPFLEPIDPLTGEP